MAVRRVIAVLPLVFLLVLPSVEAQAVVTQNSTLMKPTRDWQIQKRAANREVEGYASRVSLSPGQTIAFYVHALSPTYQAEIFRMGWYEGQRALLVKTVPSQPALPALGSEQIDPDTGLIEAPWPVAFSVNVPAGWPSGMYLVKLQASTGEQAYIPFLVRSQPAHPLLFVHTAFTDQAYNAWGGQSLYAGTTPNLNLPHAVKVSFNRPYAQENGAGHFFEWEFPMIRYLEREGIDVDYATDLDVHEHPELLRQYRGVIIAGHDEYWTKEMRDAYDAAVAHRVNLAVFGANTAYWQIRLEPSGSQDNRIIVGYKDGAKDDPFWAIDPKRVTVKWRDKPVSRPESLLLSSVYSAANNEASALFPLVVKGTKTWPYRGTGLKDGDVLTNIVGVETDRLVDPYMPQPTGTILAVSPIIKLGQSDVAQVILSQASSGAFVFNAGTLNWSWALDRYHGSKFVSKPLQIMTSNILRRFSQKPVSPYRPIARPKLERWKICHDVVVYSLPRFWFCASKESATIGRR